MAGTEAVKVNPSLIKSEKNTKAAGTAKNFNAFLGAVDAMGPAGVTAAQQYGAPNSATVLSAAFSGVSSLNAQTGGAYPSMAYGYGNGTNLGAVFGGYSGAKGTGVYPGQGTGEIIPGTGFSQAEMMNTMYNNSLKLMGLQASVQAHGQEVNTISNILAADHRARMAMIEKFTARG